MALTFKILITQPVHKLEASTVLTHSNPAQVSETFVTDTGKSLSEALLFAEHGENMLCTKLVLNVRNNFCTQHVLGIFMH